MILVLNKVLFCLLSLLVVGCCSSYFIKRHPPEPLPAFYVPEKIRVALVLGSGGVRGMAHVGVLEELEAAGIPIDIIVGCSAGSIVGALYADNPNTAEIKEAVKSVRTDSILDIDIWHCRFGLSQGVTMRRVLDAHLTANTFEELKIPLVVVASDLHTGDLVPIGSGDLVNAVQASCAIPFVFIPCRHMGRILVDGGVINPVPVKVARDLGAEVVIAVDLCELLPKTFPTNLFEIATRSAEIAFMWQNEVCTCDADVVIRPKTCGMGVFNEKMKWHMYQAGKQATKELIAKIKNIVATTSPDKLPGRRLVQLNCYTPQIYKEPLSRELYQAQTGEP